MRIARSTLVGTAVAMALFGRNGDVRAADAPADSTDSSNSVEEIVVHGYRASLQQSMETKREATGGLGQLVRGGEEVETQVVLASSRCVKPVERFQSACKMRYNRDAG